MSRVKKKISAFPLAAAMICATPSARADIGNTMHAAQLHAAPLTTENTIVPYIVKKFEGPGINPNDNGHGPSTWGINGEANGLTAQQDDTLSYPTAIRLYKTRYYDPLNIDSLPANMRLEAFNDSVQFGPGVAASMIEEANGSASELMRESAADYRSLAKRKRYRASLPIWLNRNLAIASVMGLSTQAALGIGEAEAAPITGEQPEAVIPPAAEEMTAPPEHATFRPAPETSSKIAKMLEPEIHASSATPVAEETKLAPEIVNAGDEALSAPEIINFGVKAALPLTILSGIPFPNPFRRRRRRKLHHFADPEPTSVSFTPSPANDDTTLRHEQPTTFQPAPEPEPISTPQPQTETHHAPSIQNYLDLAGFSEKERAAFHNVYMPLAPVPHGGNDKWRVSHGDDHHSIIQRNKVTLHGESGIEHSLIYAAQAWENNGCTINNSTPEMMDKFVAAAQKLVDEGKIPAGFTITGLPSFYPTPRQAARPAPQQASPTFLEPAFA